MPILPLKDVSEAQNGPIRSVKQPLCSYQKLGVHVQFDELFANRKFSRLNIL